MSRRLGYKHPQRLHNYIKGVSTPSYVEQARIKHEVDAVGVELIGTIITFKNK